MHNIFFSIHSSVLVAVIFNLLFALFFCYFFSVIPTQINSNKSKSLLRQIIKDTQKYRKYQGERETKQTVTDKFKFILSICITKNKTTKYLYNFQKNVRNFLNPNKKKNFNLMANILKMF